MVRSAIVGALLLVGGCDAVFGTDDNLDPHSHTLAITFDGEGQGWVQVEGPDASSVVCTESCEVEMAWPAGMMDPQVVVHAGSPQQLVSTSCGLETMTNRACTLSAREDLALSVRVERDPHEVLTAFFDEAPVGVAFVPGGDLVVGTTTTLRRIGADGAQRWQIPRGYARMIATTAQLVYVGPQVAAYHLDGTLSWQSAETATSLAATAMGPVITTQDGRVVALAAADGAQRWQSGALDVDLIAIDGTGRIVAAPLVDGATTLYRFAADGTPLTPSWSATNVRAIGFDPGDRLIVSTVTPMPTGIGNPADPILAYLRFDVAGASTVLASAPSVGHTGFGFAGAATFGWREVNALGRHQTAFAGATLTAYDASGAVGWELRKGVAAQLYDFTPVVFDAVTVLGGACDGVGRCAVIGDYQGTTPSHNWLEVLSVP